VCGGGHLNRSVSLPKLLHHK